MQEKKLTIYQQQKLAKPIPDDIIPDYLGEDLIKTALGFIAWLRENKMAPKWGPSSANSWTSNYKGKPILQLHLWEQCQLGNHRDFVDMRSGSQPCWTITPKLTNMAQYSDIIINEDLQNFILNNAKSCVYSERNPNFGMDKAPGCNPTKSCRPGGTITVLNKELKYNCGAFGMLLGNPDEATLNIIQRLLELEKKAREKIGRL